MIDKVEFQNKSLKTENAKFNDWNDLLRSSRMKLSQNAKFKDENDHLHSFRMKLSLTVEFED
jgi:hypothetical protein